MNIQEFLSAWLNKMASAHPWITFKHEYSERMRAYLVCVYPRERIDLSEKYCEEEVEFTEQVEESFPNDNVLFSTEEELFSCSEHAIVVKFKTPHEMSIKPGPTFDYNPSSVDLSYPAPAPSNFR